MGTPITTPGSNRDNCPKISTSCVIWQGPDIPCINLCAGDSIDEVVFKLATLLCDVTENILDVTSLEFACLVQSGQAEPTTLLQTLQLIITKVCSILPPAPSDDTAGRPGEDSSDPIVYLPECLYFEKNGDTVTALPVTEYSAYLATTVCTIIINITNNTSNIDNLLNRMVSLETIVNNFNTFTYDLYVTSQCASAPTPGQTLLIQNAFSNLETSFCNLLGTVGFSTSLISAINNQCPGLSALPQLSDSELVMNDISGWVETPTTIADSINNLWLTICDMRYKVVNFFDTPAVLPCVLAVPENLEITSITTTYSTLIWEAPSYSGIEVPIGYRIEVFQWTGTAPTGPSVYDAMLSTSFLTVNIPSSSLIVGQDYVVYLHAVYPCGESNGAKVISELLVPTILYKIKVLERPEEDTDIDCLESGLPVNYTVENKTTIATLTNAITGIPVINSTGSDIDVILKYEITSCAFFGPVYDEVTISIPNGASSADYIYEAVTYTNCGTALCTAVNKNLECGISTGLINAEFDSSTISIC
jgi:hypothetical protein